MGVGRLGGVLGCSFRSPSPRIYLIFFLSTTRYGHGATYVTVVGVLACLKGDFRLFFWFSPTQLARVCFASYGGRGISAEVFFHQRAFCMEVASSCRNSSVHSWTSNMHDDLRTLRVCCWSKGPRGIAPAKRRYIGLVAVGVQEQAADVLVPPLLRNCLTYDISHY